MFLGKILEGKTVTSHSCCSRKGTTATDLSKAPTALSLKWLTDKPAWVKQWPLRTETTGLKTVGTETADFRAVGTGTAKCSAY